MVEVHKDPLRRMRRSRHRPVHVVCGNVPLRVAETFILLGLGRAQAALKHVLRASTVGGVVADDYALRVVVTGVGDRIVPGGPALSGVLGLIGRVGASTRLRLSAGRGGRLERGQGRCGRFGCHRSGEGKAPQSTSKLSRAMTEAA